MRSGNGAGDTEMLREEILRTRRELGETVQALAARVDVRARLRESREHARARVRARTGLAGERMRERAQRTVGVVGTSLRDRASVAGGKPVAWGAAALVVAATAIVILVARGRRR